MSKGNFKPDPAKEKEKRMLERAVIISDMKAEQEAFEKRHDPHIQILFWNLSFGEQKMAHHFWVYLPRELPIDDIRNRIEGAFHGC